MISLLLFFLSFCNWVTTSVPPPHGIIPDYGYGIDIDDPIPPWISHIVESGVYKIEEVDLNYSEKNLKDSLHSEYSYFFSQLGDSIFVYENRHLLYPDIKDRFDTEIYLKSNGEEIFSTTVNDRIRSKRKKFNPNGKISEETMNFDFGTHKFIYKYDTSNFDKAVYLYTKEKIWGDTDFHVESVIFEKTDSIRRRRNTFFHSFVHTNDDRKELLYLDKNFRIVKKETSFDNKTVSEATKYSYNEYGRLLSSIEYQGDKVAFQQKWEYDKNGRCILRIDPDATFSWKYDSRGNIVEYNENYGWGGNKNTFKIYYR